MRTLGGTVLSVLGAALMVAGCSVGTATGPTGTVQGRLLEYPGPMTSNGKPPAYPVTGRVTFTDKSGHTVTVIVGASGRFSLRLAAGNYSALFAPTNLTPARENIHVQANKTLTINVLCTWDSESCG